MFLTTDAKMIFGTCIDKFTGELVTYEYQTDGKVKVKFPSPAPGLKSHSMVFTQSQFQEKFTRVDTETPDY